MLWERCRFAINMTVRLYTAAYVTSTNGGTTHWTTTTDFWTTTTTAATTTTTTQTTTTTVAGDDEQSTNMRLILIPCVLATIPVIILLVCVIRAFIRCLCGPPSSTAVKDGAGLQSVSDGIEMDKAAVAGPGACLYPASMHYQKMNDV